MVHRQWWFFQVCKQCADKNPSEVLPSLYTHCWASRRWTWPPLGWRSLITSVETCVYLEEKVSNLFTQVQPCTLHFISTRTTFVSFPFCHISSLLWKQNYWVCIRIFRLFDQSWSFMRRFGSNSSQRCSLELTESALSTGQFLSLELRGQAPLLKKTSLHYNHPSTKLYTRHKAVRHVLFSWQSLNPDLSNRLTEGKV